MTDVIRVVDPEESGRLAEIGELTALAYLADGLVDAAHPYVPMLRNAHARAEHAELLMMADGEHGDGLVVGTLTVVPPGSQFIELAQGDEFELRMLAVSPIERGRGIGARLTRYGMDLAVAQGASRIVLSTMENMHAAHRLYERLGFVRREDLDWVVIDNADGSVTKVTSEQAKDDPKFAQRGVRLIGYSWDAR
jgi:GNAT superfamily N-acetyltransferase